MSNKNLFKEAIADAKAVREAALANAKAALEEALTPKLQSMLAAKLNEMDYDMEEEGMKSDDEMEEGFDTETFGWDKEDNTSLNEEDLEEDFDLSEILAELNDEEELKEAKKEKEEAGEEAEDESEEDESEEEEPTEEEDEEEVEVKDMTIEDLKDLIKDIVSQEIETETPADEEIAPVDAMYGEMGPDVNAEEDEINLEELLAELDSLNENKVNEVDVTSAQAGLQAITDLFGGMNPQAVITALAALPAAVIGGSQILSKIKAKAQAKAGKKEEMDEAKKKETKKEKEDKKEKMDEGKISDFLDKVFGLGLSCVNTYNAAIKAAGGDKQAEKVAMAEFKKCMNEKAGGIALSGTGPVVGGFGQSGKTSADVYENEELAEAIETINTLRTELNETNLLNAKLLYVNKIFKAKNLTESQKLKVIASFDKATNVKEAKVVFESLQSALTAAPKKAIKESLGFASKAAGVAPNKTIVESNDVITRMQKLANIK